MNESLPYLTADYVGKAAEKRKYSKIVSEYYMQMYDETNLKVFRNIADSVSACSSWWFFDAYRRHNIYDLHSINLCHNKFCPNCQKLIQASRLYRFSPVLDDYTANNDLYHVVLTVPNVSGAELPYMLDLMFKKFAKLIRYIKGDGKISGFDFSYLGYKGVLRSFEVTYNMCQDSYHPHLHCLFVFKKGLNLDKEFVNSFSMQQGKLVRKFSQFELNLQRIWFLLMTGCTRLNAKTINAVELGYSCIADLIDDGNYYEVFKYAMKLWDMDNFVLDYERFKILFKALYGRRTIQGYGCLFKIQCFDEIDESVNKVYNDFIEKLKASEISELIPIRIDHLQRDLAIGNRQYITRRNIYAYVLDDNQTYEPIIKENIDIDYSNIMPDMPTSIRYREDLFRREHKDSKLFSEASLVVGDSDEIF